MGNCTACNMALDEKTTSKVDAKFCTHCKPEPVEPTGEEEMPETA